MREDTSGGTYEGQFCNGLFHGHGQMRSLDGYLYEGGWQHGKRHGTGKEVLPSGQQFEVRPRQNTKGVTYTFRFRARLPALWKAAHACSGPSKRFSSSILHLNRLSHQQSTFQCFSHVQGQFADDTYHGIGSVSYTHLTLPTKA